MMTLIKAKHLYIPMQNGIQFCKLVLKLSSQDELAFDFVVFFIDFDFVLLSVIIPTILKIAIIRISLAGG